MVAALPREDDVQVSLKALVVVLVEWLRYLSHVILCNTDKELAKEL
jgi:hypothetical protein